MLRIFISYRREDSAGHAGRLHDTLRRHFKHLFMDIDTLKPGVDFSAAIDTALSSCEALIALIGRQWLTSTDAQGQPRLANRRDFVRLEIATALKRNIPVIPVLVQGATLPRAQDLPKALAKLAGSQAHEITDTRWRYDVARLIAALKERPRVARLTRPRSRLEPSRRKAGGAKKARSVVTLRKKVRNSLDMEFVLIPAGEFQMGSPAKQPEVLRGVLREALDEERPLHTVRIRRPFYLGTYAVTQAQWEAVMGTNPSHFQGDPHRPVEMVSWEEVQEFIRELNARENSARYRLPTEAEWEYACRAGCAGTYCFGNSVKRLREYAWYEETAEDRKPHAVGLLKANAWGLYDMHGNVYEWVQDWYGAYRAEATDPHGPSSGSDRINRGGCWGHDAWACRCARRGRLTPHTHAWDTGFRLLMTACSENCPLRRPLLPLRA